MEIIEKDGHEILLGTPEEWQKQLGEISPSEEINFQKWGQKIAQRMKQDQSQGQKQETTQELEAT